MYWVGGVQTGQTPLRYLIALDQQLLACDEADEAIHMLSRPFPGPPP
jgi:hypothetical protein